MTNVLLTGVAARRAIRQHKTKNHCGYFRYMTSWFVWCHRGAELRGIRKESEEACRLWLL